MLTINAGDIISCEMVIVFYYKKCQVTLRKYNNVTILKIVGVSNMENLLIDSQSFLEKFKKKELAKYLCKNDLKYIEKVYKSLENKEYKSHDKFFSNI